MNLVSKKWMITLFSRLAVMIIIAKMLSLGLLWILPEEGVSYYKAEQTQPKYHRYSVSAMFDVSTSGVSRSDARKASMGLSSLLLKGIYGADKFGFAILALKTAPKETEVIGIGEEFNGYKLSRIEPQSVILKRQGRTYTLMIEAHQLSQAGSVAVEADDDLPRQLTRKEIATYASDVDRIWKDIGITEVKENGKITGFKVTRIKPGSPFAKLGLKKGDKITKANNKPMDSYAAALDIYKQINKLDTVALTVIRNQQEKEIIYEIR